MDLGVALGLIDPGTSVTFWSGHGLRLPQFPDSDVVSGLELGRPYDRRQMAEAAVRQDMGYLNPGPGQPAQVAIFQRSRTRKFHHVIMPAFVLAYGNFDNLESLPFNGTKTVVYLSCCHSAQDEVLTKAFQSVGADVVCGYDDRVTDEWSCGTDTAFFQAMADTCFPAEAEAELPGFRDPHTGAQFWWYGDSFVLLRAVLQTVIRGDTVRTLMSPQAYRGSSSGVFGMMHWPGSSNADAQLTINFPGSGPGSFDCSTTDGAVIIWSEVISGRSYSVQRGLVGVGGTIDVSRSESDIMTGRFSGLLGWWDAGRNPNEDPPSDTVRLKDGVFKYTGKIQQGGFGRSRFGLSRRD